MLKGVDAKGPRKPSSLSAIHIKDAIKVQYAPPRRRYLLYVHVHYSLHCVQQ